jgi:hypothetical protein
MLKIAEARENIFYYDLDSGYVYLSGLGQAPYRAYNTMPEKFETVNSAKLALQERWGEVVGFRLLDDLER